MSRVLSGGALTGKKIIKYWGDFKYEVISQNEQEVNFKWNFFNQYGLGTIVWGKSGFSFLSQKYDDKSYIHTDKGSPKAFKKALYIYNDQSLAEVFKKIESEI